MLELFGLLFFAVSFPVPLAIAVVVALVASVFYAYHRVAYLIWYYLSRDAREEQSRLSRLEYNRREGARRRGAYR